MNTYMPQTASSHSPPQTTASSPSAFSFISKGWRGVRDSADADLQLMRDRANSLKNLASSFDKEFENFINSASTFSVPAIKSPTSPTAEIEFVKRLQPKLSEFRRVYSSPDFSRKVLEKWNRKPSILRIDLSAIKKAIVEEAETGDRERRKRRVKSSGGVWSKELRLDWKGEGADVNGQGLGEDDSFGDWEPIRALKTRWKELEVKRSPEEIMGELKNSELVNKVKSSLKSLQGSPQDSKEVPPLDVPELLAYFVRQSEPFLDQLGVRRDVCNKIVDSLCGKKKSQLLLHSMSSEELSVIENDGTSDELDLRIASVVQSTGHCYDGGFWSDSTKHSLPDRKRHVAIVTTASLPWMTGTAVNPLFRAAYLAQSGQQNVTLLVPWLSESDQARVYPNNLTFGSPEEQESYIKRWLEERIDFKADFKISFYPGKFSKERRSIIPAGDTSQFIPSRDADIAILEEPEHLNWYHHGKRWTDKFNHVVGVVHTNYLEYIKREKNGAIQAFLVKHINNWVTRAYCDKVLRLSAATQDFPKSIVCNVHGVNPKFLKVGEKLASDRAGGQQVFSNGAYFLGKMVWAKGYKELLDILSKHKNDLDGFKLDVFGNGEDAHEVQNMAKSLNLSVNFRRGRDHADDSLHSYKVFVNPSVSDVLCTATAEALAMGKFVVCADHPSNEFFRSFSNCLTYKSSEDFVAKVKEAMTKEPQPLTPEERYMLSWEAATQRFIEYSDLDKLLKMDGIGGLEPRRNGKSFTKSKSTPNISEMVDGSLAFAHYCLTGSEVLRLATGATPGTRDYNKEHGKDLGVLPPLVENPVYGW